MYGTEKLSDTQMITEIYADMKAIKTTVSDFKEQVKKDNESMQEDIKKINDRLDKFESRLDSLEKHPGERAQLIINTVMKFIVLGVIGYIGKMIVDKL